MVEAYTLLIFFKETKESATEFVFHRVTLPLTAGQGE
jgi:hypothetical protein